MNRFGKVMLVATSLTPIFLVCGVKCLIPQKDPSSGTKHIPDENVTAAIWFFSLFSSLTVVFFIHFIRSQEEFTQGSFLPNDQSEAG